jgi:outer membrane protein TolC
MNKKSFLVVSILLMSGIWQAASAQQTTFTLEDIIERGRINSPSAKQAETRKENRYWQYRFFRSNYNPQLRLNGSLPGFSQDVASITQPDGSIEFRSRNQTNSFTNLGLLQPLPWTGGELSVNSNLNYFQDRLSGNDRWNGTPIFLRLNQPIFAFNQLRWDKMTEPLRYEESKREYVEQQEFVSRVAVELFFGVLEAQINRQIADFNLANNDTIYKIEQGRYNIGTTSMDKLLQVELQLLRSQQGVSQARLDLENAKLRLRSYIGIRDDREFNLQLPDEVPLFIISEEEALQRAKDNRADFIAFERRRLEAEREVAQAKGQRFQTSMIASFGLNQSGTELNEVYIDPLRQQTVNLQFNVPIIDWGRNKSRMQTALANKRLNDYIIDQDIINFEQEIITQVRQFEMLRMQIQITRKSDEVALQRYIATQNRYLIGKTDITNLNLALTEKDDAKRSYVAALRGFWTAYYDLRRLTLYDFLENRLLYNPNTN